MEPITLAALISGGMMLGKTGLQRLLQPGNAGGMGGGVPASLGQTFMSSGGAMPSAQNLYPKKPERSGSLLGNSGIDASMLAQYLGNRGGRPTWFGGG